MSDPKDGGKSLPSNLNCDDCRRVVAVAVVDPLMAPGLRWLLRGRVNRVVEDLNTRLRHTLPLLSAPDGRS